MTCSNSKCWTNFLSVREISNQPYNGHLEMEKHLAGRVRGCFIQNSSLAVCFEIRQGLIELTNKNEDTLVRYIELADDKFYFQVMDRVFIGKKSSPFPLHTKSRSLKSKRGHLRSRIPRIQKLSRKERFADMFFKALDKLHNTREITLLHRISVTLKENTSDHVKTEQLHVIFRRFHVMCLSLFSQESIDIKLAQHKENAFPDDQRRGKGFGDVNIPQKVASPRINLNRKHHIKKRDGVNLSSDPFDNKCLGMCGPRCSCRESVCGNCDFNNWCYGHDQCCRKDDTTTWCLLPFLFIGASCEDSFEGLQNCLH